MAQNVDVHSLSPADLRRLIRNEDPRISTTSGLASGFQQANVTMLPVSLAEDFEAFCQRNVAPLHLLYRSRSGETDCPALAKDADIRTDIPHYCIYNNGKMVKTASNLKEYSNEFRDMVCFYLGCSFGFEGKLKEAGVPVRNVEQKKNVSMYRTSVPCVPAGVFHCPLVVSMRPFPAEMLDAAVEVTHLNPQAHGAPVHIGDPALLGIQDLSRPDYGDAVDQQPGDVPVFWACGVTSSVAVLTAKPALAFSHSPGCMFLTDLPDSSSSSAPGLSGHSLHPELTPLSFKLSHKPLLYSLASKRAVHKIRQLEKIINEKKNPGALTEKDALIRCCLALSHTSSVAIVTHRLNRLSPGAVAMANMLLSLGKRVTMVTDWIDPDHNIVQESARGEPAATIPLVAFEDDGPDSALHFLRQNGDKPRYDHVVAMEPREEAAAVTYNKRKEKNDHVENVMEKLLDSATNSPGINTTGVSNWGGYAVACGLFLLQTCPSHQRYLKKGLGLNPTQNQDEAQTWTTGLSLDKVESLARKEDNQIITRLLQVTLDRTHKHPDSPCIV